MPLLGLLGILEAGRGITAPMSVGGEWTIECEPASACANGAAGLSISQSGTEAQVTLHDRLGTTFETVVSGDTLTAPALHASISGGPRDRVLTGQLKIRGGMPMTFRAVRQAGKKRAE